jgi:lipopolysaccharide transport system permease protein
MPSSVAPATVEAPVKTVIRPQTGWIGLDLPGLWQYRELLYFLLWRDLKVRYKQTVLGAAWAVIQPVCTVILFTVIFGSFAKLPSDGVPYPVYAYCALLPWNLFSGSINRSGGSLVASANLISKVYFPRLIVPMSAALGALVDFLISFCVLLVLMLVYGMTPGVAILTVPVWTALAALLGLAVGLGLSALNVKYRDVSYLMGFMLQIWMYASPVVYSASIVPERFRWIYALNPMAGIIQGFRWAITGVTGEMGIPWIPAVVVTIALLTAALVYFRQVERRFADIV